MANDETRTSDTQINPAEQLLEQRKAFETAVTLRTWSDPAFAEALRGDPAAAINAAFGIELPAELDIQLHHETPTTLHLALPQKPTLAADGHELTEDDLERVAGGSLIIVQTAFVASTAAGISAASAGLSAASVTVTMRIAKET